MCRVKTWLISIAVLSVFILSNAPLYASDLTFDQMFVGNDLSPPRPKLLEKSGKITFLRVSAPNDQWGPHKRALKAEVIIKLDSFRGALGFQLRNDKHLPANQAMLQLLMDAYRNNWTVTLDATIPFITYATDANIKVESDIGYILRVLVKK